MQNLLVEKKSNIISATDTDMSSQTNYKMVSLVVLVLQNSLQSVVMRYSRVGANTGPPYLASTAVLLGEVMKLIGKELKVSITVMIHNILSTDSYSMLSGCYLHSLMFVIWFKFTRGRTP